MKINKFILANHIKLILFNLLIISNLFAQKPELTFFNTTYDFGEIGKQYVPPAIFKFQNTGDADLVVVLSYTPEGINARSPKYYIAPGKTDSILISYSSGTIGSFTETVQVNSNASDNSVILTVKGIITEVLECPNPYNSKKTIVKNQEFLVLDKETNFAVNRAEISLKSRYNEYRCKTGANGKAGKEMNPGNYKIDITANEYIPQKDYRYIVSDGKTIVYYLEKVKTNAVVEKEEEKEKTTPLLETPKHVITHNQSIITDSDEILSRNKYSPNNIVFLLDVSASMKGKTKIEYLKYSVGKLIDALRDIDKVSLITYDKEANVIFNGINGDNKDQLNEFIDSIYAEGGTRGITGLTKAYEIALRNFIQNGNNQVIIATDGEFKSADYSEKELTLLIRGNLQMGISLSVVGFGTDSDARKSMKKMAHLGNGNYLHIAKESDIENILIEEIKKKSLIE